MTTLGNTLLYLALLISSIYSVPQEKSYQNGLLAFSEWDLNRDCIVTEEEFKSWVLDMLMAVIKYQALVTADQPSRKDLDESTYEAVMRRVMENMGRMASNGANENKVMERFLDKLTRKLNDHQQYNNVAAIAQIFKFNTRQSLTFWYNL